MGRQLKPLLRAVLPRYDIRHTFRDGEADQPAAALSVTTSRRGGAPNMRAYSRLNCDALS
jgi:hypothetical protein